MKLLAVADIHGSQYRLNIVLKNVEKYKPDLVVICGDITQFGPGDVAKDFLDQIPVSTLAIPGNIDTGDVSRAIDESKAINIDLKRVRKKGIAFVGISGAVNTMRFLSNSRQAIDKLLGRKSILVSHVPPHGSQDRVFFGIHAGSKELKAIVEKYHPRLVLCGHIHENPGYTKVDETVVVNCSLAKHGEGALIEINGDITVKML
jgi:hypothetical protein